MRADGRIDRHDEADSRFSQFCEKRLKTYVGQGKAIPLQTWTGPEGSSRLRFPDFKTIGT